MLELLELLTELMEDYDAEPVAFRVEWEQDLSERN